MPENDDLEKLSLEEEKIKDLWTKISKYAKRDLAYVWVDEVRRYFLDLETETEKVAFILRKLHSYYRKNKQEYAEEILHLRTFISDLNKIQSKTKWVMQVHNDLQQIILDIEREKSEYLIETVMKKVKDINERGLAYSSIDAAIKSPRTLDQHKFKEILEDGILGNKRYLYETKERGLNKKRWYAYVRQLHKGVVFFNIVGRTSDTIKPSELEINNSLPMTESVPSDRVVIIFDLSSFKEIEPVSMDIEKHKTYHADDPQIYLAWEDLLKGQVHLEELKRSGLVDEKGRPLPSTEYGFVLSFRVAPRYFCGIVFKCIKEEGGLGMEDRNPSVLQARAKEIVSVMLEVYKDKPELFIPVYDTRGNLYWPKRMTYEEVKRFIYQKVEGTK